MLFELSLIVFNKYFLMFVPNMMIIMHTFKALRTQQDTLTCTIDHMRFIMFLAPVLGQRCLDLGESV
jgi:hypothetical protein